MGDPLEKEAGRPVWSMAPMVSTCGRLAGYSSGLPWERSLPRGGDDPRAGAERDVHDRLEQRIAEFEPRLRRRDRFREVAVSGCPRRRRWRCPARWGSHPNLQSGLCKTPTIPWAFGDKDRRDRCSVILGLPQYRLAVQRDRRRPSSANFRMRQVDFVSTTVTGFPGPGGPPCPRRSEPPTTGSARASRRS